MSATNRQDVYKLIDGERLYQDKAWATNNPQSAQPLTIGEELLLLEVYLRDAIDQWKVEPRPEVLTMGMIRKITAIGVRAMETHGAPERDLGFLRRGGPDGYGAMPPQTGN